MGNGQVSDHVIRVYVSICVFMVDTFFCFITVLTGFVHRRICGSNGRECLQQVPLQLGFAKPPITCVALYKALTIVRCVRDSRLTQISVLFVPRVSRSRSLHAHTFARILGEASADNGLLKTPRVRDCRLNIYMRVVSANGRKHVLNFRGFPSHVLRRTWRTNMKNPQSSRDEHVHQEIARGVPRVALKQYI